LNKKGKLLEGGAQHDAKGQKNDGGMRWVYDAKREAFVIWIKRGERGWKDEVKTMLQTKGIFSI
jgi:hypothetical protein